jgi:cytochrome oxidase Cu insertion factor (SCO1/SenC/PrrC family)
MDLRAYCAQPNSMPIGITTKDAASRMTPDTALLYNLERRGKDPMEVNDKAPEFNTTDENGKEVALKDYRGKTVVLFFYPKADTPG